MDQDQTPPATPPPAPPAPGAPPPPMGGTGDGGGPRLPWEERQSLGFLDSLIATVKLLVTAPADAFGRLRRDGDMISPILFGILLTLVGQIFSQIWNLLFGAAWMSMLGGMGDMMEMGEGMGGMESLAFFGATNIFSALITLVLTPIFYLIFLFIASGIYHLCLMLFGAVETSPQGFEGTLKVTAYASVASLGAIIPVVGGLITLIAQIILLVIGFQHVHRTTQGKAIGAVLLPIVICCVCAVVGALLFGGMIAGLASQGGG